MICRRNMISRRGKIKANYTRMPKEREKIIASRRRALIKYAFRTTALAARKNSADTSLERQDKGYRSVMIVINFAS